jgi:hypothetical protein
MESAEWESGEPELGSLWHDPSVPKLGWRLLHVFDLNPSGESPDEVEYATCEMCGRRPIRFVHAVDHPDWRLAPLEVGRVCVEKLTRDWATHKAEENRLSRLASKRVRFIESPRWQARSNGNHVYRHDGVCVTLMPSKFDRGQFVYVCDGRWHGPFASIRAAKADAFDVVCEARAAAKARADAEYEAEDRAFWASIRRQARESDN